MMTAARFILLSLLLSSLMVGCQTRTRPTTAPAVPVAVAAAEPIGPYVIQPGDVLQISLYYHSELDQAVTVRTDGMITLKLLDEVRAAGLRPAELDEVLTERYTRLLRKPEVSVTVAEASDQRVYVGGEVNQPGVIPLRGKVTALQAIFQAGGYKKTGRMNQVVVLRDRGNGKAEFITLDLKAQLDAPGGPGDLPLRASDMVFVPKTTIAGMNDFVEQYIDRMLPFVRSVGVSYNFGPQFND